MVEQSDIRIPTYVINLKERKDRLHHMTCQFSDKPEFEVTVIEAAKHEVGAIGLWHSILEILKLAVNLDQEFIIICEDDHEFTSFYRKEHLISCIEEAKAYKADILSCGVSSLRNAICISGSLFWVEHFTGLQFTVIFKPFFEILLAADFKNGDVADYKICSLTSNKFLIYPFISMQREFGYSDVTVKNNKEGRITSLFERASETLQHLIDVAAFYKGCDECISLKDGAQNFDDVALPTYIINLQQRTDRRKHILNQFAGRKEFDINIIDAIKHPIGAVGLWNTIRKIVSLAVKNEEDVIIICEDDHEFTSAYSKKYLIKNIIEAHHQGADILSGGIGSGFNHALQVSENRFWINHFYCTQFIVVYARFFHVILNEPFDDQVTADDFISELTSNKMVLFPFISIQKDFGYSDVTIANNQRPGLISAHFKNGETRLQLHKRTTEKYGKTKIGSPLVGRSNE